MKVMVIQIVIGALGMVPKDLVRGREELKFNETGWNHKDYRIVVIGQITEKSLGHLTRLAVTQIPVKKHAVL